jgi:hypothetical protein
VSLLIPGWWVYILGFTMKHILWDYGWKLIANIREEKNRDIVFREIINTLEIKPISPSGVFCLGVYYTRDNTYKDCYIRQGRSQ